MTEDQIIDGIPKIVDNAESLYSDAELLESNNRIPRAYSLYQLSIEEIAKAFILLGAAIFEDLNDPNTQKTLNKTILHHKIKSKKSIGIDVFLQEFVKSIDIERYESLVLDSFDEFEQLDHLNTKKNHGLYTSFVGNEFQPPSQLIDQNELYKLRNKAAFRIYVAGRLSKAFASNFQSLKQELQKFDLEKIKSNNAQSEEFARIREKYGLDR